MTPQILGSAGSADSEEEGPWTYMGHHRVLRKAGDGLGGLQLPDPISTPLQRLHLAIRSTGFCLLLPGSMGENGGYA